MSIEALHAEVRALSSEQRRKLMALMVALEDQNRPDYAAEMARRMDAPWPDRWLTSEQCERQLGLS